MSNTLLIAKEYDFEEVPNPVFWLEAELNDEFQLLHEVGKPLFKPRRGRTDDAQIRPLLSWEWLDKVSGWEDNGCQYPHIFQTASGVLSPQPAVMAGRDILLGGDNTASQLQAPGLDLGLDDIFGGQLVFPANIMGPVENLQISSPQHGEKIFQEGSGLQAQDGGQSDNPATALADDTDIRRKRKLINMSTFGNEARTTTLDESANRKKKKMDKRGLTKMTALDAKGQLHLALSSSRCDGESWLNLPVPATSLRDVRGNPLLQNVPEGDLDKLNINIKIELED